MSNVPGSGVQPEKNQIAFQVIEGVAVAFGDIILGTVADPEITDGLADAPVPQLWDKSEIAFSIQPDLPNPERVKEAIDYLTRKTSLVFVPYEGQTDAIVFEKGDKHCLSLLGRQGGLQPIKLSATCGQGEILHEILHALGFIHEQSRTDRGGFVEVVWDNIEEEYKSQFAIAPESFMEAERGFPFDYRSAMLYPSGLFSAKPGLPTLRSRTQNPIAPVRDGLSEGDIEKIKRLYHP